MDVPPTAMNPGPSHRLRTLLRAWMVRRNRLATAVRNEEAAWAEVRSATDEAEGARIQFRQSFADLEAEVIRRRGGRADNPFRD